MRWRLLINSRIAFASFLLFIVIAASCNRSNEKQRVVNQEQLRESLIRANIVVRMTEDEQIDDFAERRCWNLEKTGSGLRYLIYRHGEGIYGKEGMTAVVNYTLKSISGDIIYTSAESGPMKFLIGKGGVESGLEEAILLLKVGDKAKIIIPSHLGYGLAGDGHKIPPKSTLIYDLEVLEIN